jgi:predicted NodU family carbamoyl transferase
MRIIAVNTLHDSSITVFDSTSLHNLELERLTRDRYLDLSIRSDTPDILRHAMQLLGRHLAVENRFDMCLHHGEAEQQAAVEESVNARVHEATRSHHQAHAAAALYASPFPEAVIISFDGGGYDGVFNVYTGRRGDDLRLEARMPYNLGTSYRLFAHSIGEIRKRPLPPVESSLDLDVELAAAGKLMGLAAYGTSRSDWTIAMKDLMRSFGHGEIIRDAAALLRQARLPSQLDELSGQAAFDFAASAQRAFEDVFMEAAGPYLRGSSLPVCLTGGAALNRPAQRTRARHGRARGLRAAGPERLRDHRGIDPGHTPPRGADRAGLLGMAAARLLGDGPGNADHSPRDRPAPRAGKGHRRGARELGARSACTGQPQHPV